MPTISRTTGQHANLKPCVKPAIYLDNAATTYVDPRVLEAMLPYFSEEYGNAESLHEKGMNARIALDNSRETIAKILNCQPTEITFTSGGTEANNLAILGAARANKSKEHHLITTTIEHSSISEPFKKLEEEGYKITMLKVDSNGLIDLEEFKSSLRPDTTLVSIIYANNEIGTIEPIREIGRICREKGIIFHTDACQAAGAKNIDVEELNVDLMTISGSKIYGPKGVSALFVRKNTKIEPIIFGGSHENDLRGGTHNIPGIVGLAKALELAQQEHKTESIRLTKLRDLLISGILEKVPGTKLNGPNPKNYEQYSCPRLPNNINFSIEGIIGQDLLLQLNEAGIYVSTGAACKVRTSKPSSVLKAIGVPLNLIQNSIRISLGKKTTPEDIEYVLQVLPKIVEQIIQRG